MRASIQAALIISLALLIFLNSAAAQTCYRPTGWFASEVLLNKPGVTYDLSLLEETGNVSVVRTSVLYRSHYDDRVAVIITPMELFQEKGLDLRLQLPTRTVATTTQSFVLDTNETVRVADLELMGGKTLGWILNLDYRPDPMGGPPIQVANLTKGNLKVSLIPLENETIARTYVGLEVTNMTTLNEQNRTEFSKIFDSIGYPTSFETFVKGKDFKVLPRVFEDLESAIDLDSEFDWEEAMKAELEFLIRNRVVSGLTDSDVETLSALAPYAWGEHNFKARWYNDGWVLGITEEMLQAEYTYEYRGAPNCEGFQSSYLPDTQVQDFNAGFQPQLILMEQSFIGAGLRAAIVGGAILTVSVLFLRRRHRLRAERN